MRGFRGKQLKNAISTIEKKRRKIIGGVVELLKK